MPSSKITDYSTRSLEFLASQFKEADNLIGFIQAIIESVQDVEDVADDLLTDRLDFWTAEGIQLDNIGTIVGVLRAGLSDALYRIEIANTIIRNSSLPTPNDFIQSIISLTGSTVTRFWELVPAGIQMHFNGDAITGLDELADNLAPAGVNIELVKEYVLANEVPFVFANDDSIFSVVLTDPDRGLGFTELGYGDDQGYLSERIV